MEINENTSVEEILRLCPETLRVFEKFKLQVFICGEPVWDTLGQLCETKDVRTEELVEELKKICL
ncbi:MAG: hypothetical protein COT17_04170 [Elusimicrobia bacterium CG08_land_8_20_14_0_20_51_18]|nr:MAG: hypothetical protein COT17_04170 [Elusimicrobia bacterium CG08_land_8_20_14_0_20_51_18]